MNARRLLILLLLGSFPGLTGCAAHYQDLLRDRDAEIRELEAELADARAQNAELSRREQAALAQLADAQRARPVEASSQGDLAERVQRELGDETDVRYESGRLSIGIENTVTFNSGSVDIKDTGTSVLKRVANLLRREFDNRRIYVEGHTDTDPIKRTRGTFRSNRHLSVERADAVARYLIEKCDMDGESIAVVGYGEYKPRVDGSSDSAKAKNRRVEIVVGEPL